MSVNEYHHEQVGDITRFLTQYEQARREERQRKLDRVCIWISVAGLVTVAFVLWGWS